MVWFRIDDGFHSHPKVARLFEGERPGEAIGLWTLAGSWCSDKLTDGFVPHGQLKRFGLDPAVAAELVRVGLWFEGEGGYWFHDWSDKNPSREHVLAERDAGVKRSQASRARRGRDKRASHTRVSGETEASSRPELGRVSHDPIPIPIPEEEDQLRTALRADFSLPVQPAELGRARALVANDVVPDLETIAFDSQDEAQLAMREFQQALPNIANAHPLTQWRQDWKEIGAKPPEERDAVIRTLRASRWATRNWRRCSPKHVAKHWALYANGEEPGRAAESDDGTDRRPRSGRRAGPSEIASPEEYEKDAGSWTGSRAAGGRARDKL